MTHRLNPACPFTSSLFTQTSEEVYEKMTGLIVPLNRQRNTTMALGDTMHRMPTHLDYRKKGMVTSVKNQVSARHPLTLSQYLMITEVCFLIIMVQQTQKNIVCTAFKPLLSKWK